MVKSYLFKDRDGQTPLPDELKKGLIPRHIQTIGELDEYEENNIAFGLVWLDKYDGEHLSIDFWLKLHNKLFDKVWKWAGDIRRHQLHNPDFHEPHQIWESLKVLEGDIHYWLKEQSYPEKEIAARFHERIETIHPFANGNGRFGRIVTEYVCQREGFNVPKWGLSMKNDPQRRRASYIDALESARRMKSYQKLIVFMFR